MKILLTGITGQVGHALQNSLKNIAEIIPVTRMEMDLSQPKKLAEIIQAIKPNLIINPAAYTNVDKAEEEVEQAEIINAKAVGLLAHEAQKLNIPLIHYSTDYVFDGNKCDASGNPVAYDENDACNPLGVYGKSKLNGEKAILASGCDHLILRTSWVYSDFGRNFLLTMLRLANERDQLSVVNDQWGAPTSAHWIAEASAQLVRIAVAAQDQNTWWKSNTGIVHLCSANFTNWYEFSEEIFKLAEELNLLTKIKPKVHGITTEEYPTKAKRPKNSMLSTRLLQQQFGILAPPWQISLRDCLQRMS